MESTFLPSFCVDSDMGPIGTNKFPSNQHYTLARVASSYIYGLWHVFVMYQMKFQRNPDLPDRLELSLLSLWNQIYMFSCIW